MNQLRKFLCLALALCLSMTSFPAYAAGIEEETSAAEVLTQDQTCETHNSSGESALEEFIVTDSILTAQTLGTTPAPAQKQDGPMLPAVGRDFDLGPDDDYSPNVSFSDNTVEPANYTTRVGSTTELAQRLSALINKYQNTYWTQDGSPCASHKYTCNSRYYYAWQCKGFAGYIFNDLFCGGSIGPYKAGVYYYIPSPNNATLVGKASGYASSDVATVKNILEKAQPGDFIQVRRRNKSYGHSMIVVGVDSGGLYIFDCNSDGKCGVRYYYQTWATFASKNSGMSLYHSTYYPADTCSCSDSYAGDYICTTESSNLIIRSAHSTSSSVVGKIPPGATVRVTRANGDWAHVEYNGMSGYASMAYLRVKGSETAVDAKIHYWVSHDQMGESFDSAKVGDWVYLCYRMYDANSGKNLNEVVPGTSFTATETVYNPDGSVAFSYTYSDADSNWIGTGCYTPGTYTYEVVLEGDWYGTFTGTFEVEENPKEIHASTDEVELKIDGTKTETIYTWLTGYHPESCQVVWERSNDHISCSWGEWTDDGLLPLTITANSVGTATVKLRVEEHDSGKVLDTYTVNVTVTSSQPPEITASVSSMTLTLGGTDRQTIDITKSGYYDGSMTFRISRSNTNVTHDWGSWNGNTCPITIIAKTAGTTVLTFDLIDKETEAVLDTVNVNVTVNAKTYTISYNANGGTGAPGTQTKYHGTALTLSTKVPEKTGYSFLGWATTSGASKAEYQPGASFTSEKSTTLYAVWKHACSDGHSYSYSVTKTPTQSASGALTGTCSRCSGVTTVTLPKLNTTDYTYSVVKQPTPTATGLGRYTWKVTSYGNYAFDVTLEKTAAELSTLTLVSGPDKTVYQVGETLDTTGLTLKAGYTDGSYKTITSGFTTSGFDSSTSGSKTVKVTYGGKSVTFSVTVEQKKEETDPNGPRLEAEKVTASPGSTVSVTVKIANNPGFGGMAYDVSYDPSVLTLQSYDLGLGSSICTDSGDVFSNKINFQYGGTENVTGDGVLVTLTFQVKEDAESGFSTITVTPEEGTSFRYDGRKEIDFSLGAVNGGVEIMDYVKGDINGDGKVNNRDAVRLMQYLAGWDVDYVAAALDVNGDGRVNNRDAVRLMQYLAGWDVAIN